MILCPYFVLSFLTWVFLLDLPLAVASVFTLALDLALDSTLTLDSTAISFTFSESATIFYLIVVIIVFVKYQKRKHDMLQIKAVALVLKVFLVDRQKALMID